MKLLSFVADILHPHRCTFCQKAISYRNHTFICNECMKNLPYITGKTCALCNRPREENSLPVCAPCLKNRYRVRGAFTPLIYTDSVRRALINMKFYNKDFFCHSFAFLICDSILRKETLPLDFVTFVPISENRFKERGFNQSELIAKECAKILNLPLIDTLNRKNNTPRQSTLSFSERRKNAKNSYSSKDIPLHGNALLIDDIYTTGSTINACASLLLKMGCENVYISAVALREKE